MRQKYRFHLMMVLRVLDYITASSHFHGLLGILSFKLLNENTVFGLFHSPVVSVKQTKNRVFI